MQTIIDELIITLSKDKRFAEKGIIKKSTVIDHVLRLDKDLLKLLLSNPSLKNTFFNKIDDTLVFDKQDFQRFVSNKAFLPDSYTAFKNKIGLIAKDGYLSDSKEIVLGWPYKDCILEGGQQDGEEKRNEIFWNTTLAPEEVDRLLTPKALTNFKKYGSKGEEHVKLITPNDNLIIKGNNLLALCSLGKSYSGRVKQIYIDPPYNRGNDEFNYNDSFNHSAWLTFMKSRLQVSRQLLTSDGSIWLNIDDNEAHYLKVMMDELYGRENFIANIIWEKKYTVANDARYFSDTHDHILIYAKQKDLFKINKLPRTEEMNKAYSNPDNHPKGPWKATPLHAKSGSKKSENNSYTFQNGITWSPPPGTYPRFSETTLKEMDSKNEIWFGKDGNSVPSRKTFLSNLDENSVTPKTIFKFDEVGHNHEARNELKALFSDNPFSTPKPERLIQRIIHLGSNEGDIILDFFLGSGTTIAVAQKMSRQYIGIEQMNYIDTIVVERMKKVISGDKGGISKAVGWKGGGSFIYAELMLLNSDFVRKVDKANKENEIDRLLNFLISKGTVSFLFNNTSFRENQEEFNKLSLSDKKTFLLELLDRNSLYLPLSEIEDADYEVSIETKKLNQQFYTSSGRTV